MNRSHNMNRSKSLCKACKCELAVELQSLIMGVCSFTCAQQIGITEKESDFMYEIYKRLDPYWCSGNFSRMLFWRDRAEKAEAEVKQLMEALKEIAYHSVSQPLELSGFPELHFRGLAYDCMRIALDAITPKEPSND